MTTIAAVAGALPEHRAEQAAVTEMLAARIDDDRARRLLRRVHGSAGVRTRWTVLPLEQYATLDGFGAANALWTQHAVDLGARALATALAEAGLEPSDVDTIVFTTVTGVAAPSVDARIAARLGLRADVKRMPMFGLGCVGGAAGVARLHDLLRGAPDDVAVLVSVELCSLTVQADDHSAANLVASGLFGDGAAAVVAVGERRAASLDRPSGPRVLASRSTLYPDTQRVMGWDVGDTGFGIVLDPTVPTLARRHLPDDVGGFLADHGLTVADIGTWVSHPGGPKVIEAVEQSLGLPPDALELTWRSLSAVGNMSSASVLHVLRDTLDKHPAPGTSGLMLAMGPGFCSEVVLLEWV